MTTSKFSIGTTVKNSKGQQGEIVYIITKSTGYVQVKWENGTSSKEMAFNLTDLEGNNLKSKPGKKNAKPAFIHFTMETLKANRNEIIADILRDCDKENLAVVMNKMVSMINEGYCNFKSVLAFVSAAEEELREDGIEVVNSVKSYNNLIDMMEAGKHQQRMAL